MIGESAWLSLSEAASLLGVHFTTLRRWADQGLIEYMRTPGGKRKFQRKAIEEFLDRYRSAVVAPLMLSSLSEEAVTKTRQTFQEHGLANQSWFLRLSEDQRLNFRGTGSRLVALMFQYSARDSGGEVFLEEARRIAKDYGQACCSMGLSAAECVQMFLFFRRPMLNAVQETGSLKGIGDEESRRLFIKVTEFLDEILVAMVAEYTLYQSPPNLMKG